MEGKNNKSGIQKLEAKINSDIERFSQEYYFGGDGQVYSLYYRKAVGRD